MLNQAVALFDCTVESSFTRGKIALIAKYRMCELTSESLDMRVFIRWTIVDAGTPLAMSFVPMWRITIV